MELRGAEVEGRREADTAALATGEKSVTPNGIAIRVPVSSPSSTAICLTKPRVKRRSSRTISRVRPARVRFVAEP